MDPAGSELNKAFGPYGGVLQSLLSSGGGYSPSVFGALQAQAQPQIARGAQALMEQFGGGGGRFSDAASSALAQYYAQTGLDMRALNAQLYEHAYDNMMQEVLGLAGPIEQYQQSRPTFWDKLGSIAGIAGSLLGLGGIGGLFKRGSGGTPSQSTSYPGGSFMDPGIFTSTTPYSSLPGAEAGFGTGWLPGMQQGPYSNSPFDAASLIEPSASVSTSYSPLTPIP